MTVPLRIAIIGYGKIATDQHVPAIAGDPGLTLAATVSRRKAGPEGVPAFASIAELRESGLAVDAVALCNTPEDRPGTAFEAIAAGWHVLMEKPPATTLGAVAQIEAAAKKAGVCLFATWHSRFAPAVAEAKRLLAGRTITALAIDWREDVRKWHPGQDWVWEPGGFGVFDPGINGLSVATEILPMELAIGSAVLEVPANRAMPIAAELHFTGPGVPEGARAGFDWRETKGECWQIRVEADGDILLLTEGGAKLSRNGALVPVTGPGEYPALYRRFAELVTAGESEVDVRPLRLAADAFLLGTRRVVEPFTD
jgi:D-galactose 1-dehydrogenase